VIGDDQWFSRMATIFDAAPTHARGARPSRSLADQAPTNVRR